MRPMPSRGMMSHARPPMQIEYVRLYTKSVTNERAGNPPTTMVIAAVIRIENKMKRISRRFNREGDAKFMRFAGIIARPYLTWQPEQLKKPGDFTSGLFSSQAFAFCS